MQKGGERVAEVDSLEISIEASATHAVERVNELISALERLKNTYTNIPTRSLGKLPKTPKADYSSLSAEVEKLGAVFGKMPPSIQKYATALAKARTATNALSGVKVSGSVDEVRSALNLATSAIEKTNSKLKSSKLAIREYADAFAQIPASVQRAVSANAKIEASTKTSSKSFGLLNFGISETTAKFGIYAAAFHRAKNTMGDWVTSINSYIESTNLFSVSMGKFYDQAFSYATLVNEKLGVDPAAWMDAQGTFALMAEGFGISEEQAYKLSKGLTELAYDISSLKNMNPEEAVTDLRSALAGELEPIRKLGLSISQATLQEYALSKGIKESVTSMTEQEKALLRSVKVMEDAKRIGYVGDFIKTLESPANAIRILNQQITQLGRALGSVLLPIITQVIPWIQAFVSVLTDAINALAKLVGFVMPEWDNSSWDTSDAWTDTEGAINGATSAAKEFKRQLMGIDELTVLQEPSGSGSGGGDLSDWASDLTIPEIWSEQMLADINSKADQLKQTIQDLLPIIAGVASGLATWAISKKFLDDIGMLPGLLGSLLVAAGITLLVDAIDGIIFGDGLTWENVLTGAGGGAAIGGGLGIMLAKKLGLKWHQGLLGGAVIGLTASLLLMSIVSTVKSGMTWQSILLGTAGGVGLGITLAKTLGLQWIQGGLAGAVVALGITLVIDSIRNIAMGDGVDKNLFYATAGAGGAGGALGLMLAKKLGLSFGAAGIPVAAIAIGLSWIISGVTAQIANGVNLTGAVSTILGSALAGAGLGSIIPGAGTGVGLVVGLGVGLLIELIGINEAGEAAYQATEDFQVMAGILERSADASDRASTAMDTLKSGIENLDNSMADFALASQLVDEIYAINENAHASNYELELMAVKVDVLNGLGISGLSLSIDETTGRVVEARQEVEKLIESLQREAQMEAMQQLLVQSFKDQYQALYDAERASRDYDAASQALAETAAELDKTSWFDFQKRSELTAAQKEQTEAVDAARQAIADSAEAYNEISGAIDTYTGMLVDMKTAGEGLTNPAQESLDELKTKLEETAITISEDGKNIGTGLLKGVDESVKENEYRNIFQRIGDWFCDVFGIHSPSTVMMEYGGYITDGLLQGITNTWGNIQSFFTDSLAKMWGSISEWFTLNKWMEMVSSIYESIKTTWGETVKQWNTDLRLWWSNDVSPWFTLSKWKEIVKNISDSIKQTVDSMVTTWESSMTSWWNNDVKPWFSIAKWKELGKSALEGLFSGLSNIGNKIKTWGGNLVAGVKNFFGIASPSKLFRDDIGINLGLGISEGFASSEKAILNSVASVTGNVKNAFTGLTADIQSASMPAMPSHTYEHFISNEMTREQIVNATYQPHSNEGNDASTGDIISTLMAITQRLVTAIEENSGTPVYINGQQITNYQNNANRMYGRTQQNV